MWKWLSELALGPFGWAAKTVGLGKLVPGYDEDEERRQKRQEYQESERQAENTANVLLGAVLFNGIFPGVMQDAVAPVYGAVTSGLDGLLSGAFGDGAPSPVAEVSGAPQLGADAGSSQPVVPASPAALGPEARLAAPQLAEPRLAGSHVAHRASEIRAARGDEGLALTPEA